MLIDECSFVFSQKEKNGILKQCISPARKFQSGILSKKRIDQNENRVLVHLSPKAQVH